MIKLQEQSKDIRVVVYAPDGRLISGGSDKRVRIWDPLSGECKQTIKAPNVVYALAVSQDGKTLAYAGRHANATDNSNTVFLWNMQTAAPAGELVWDMDREARSIWSLSFSADGAYLAAACRRLGGGGFVNGAGGHWWDWPDTREEGDFAETKIYSLSFGPVGRRLAVTRERTVAIQEEPRGWERTSFRLQSDWAAAVAFIPPGDRFVAAAASRLYFLDAVGKAKPKRIKSTLRTITSLAVSQDGRFLLAGGKPGGVEFYDLQTMALAKTLDFGIGAVHGVAVAPDGLTFAMAGDQGLTVADIE